MVICHWNLAGKLCLLFTQIIKLDYFRFFVVDEVDGLLQQNHTNLIVRLHSMIPRMFDDGARLQMIVCSATLHNFDVKKLAERLMYFPSWVDLKVINWNCIK